MKQYHLHLPDGTQFGPMAESVIRRDMRENRYPAGTLVWAEGMEEWQPLEGVLSPSERPAIPEPEDAGAVAEEAARTPWGILRHTLTHWSFEGRATRQEFWLSALMLTVAAVLLLLLLQLLASAIGGSTALILELLISQLGPCALVLALLPVGCRRLHDAGYSGWWQLLWLLSPLGPLALAILACQDSQYGNAYGPSTKYPD